MFIVFAYVFVYVCIDRHLNDQSYKQSFGLSEGSFPSNQATYEVSPTLCLLLEILIPD